ncbi:MAG: Uma2 family endonuclease [Alphaproteobacteria bacterium]|nr:Uma2 family endonuclease [Alphaproteobacteria bacterium]
MPDAIGIEHCTGSMGSRFTLYRFVPEEIPRLAKLDWNAIGRRVFIDPVRGMIALMSPSPEHEEYTRGIDRTVQDMCRALGLRIVTLGSTRWRRPDDPENSGAEPDACFYLGMAAERRDVARRKGIEALAEFYRHTPPDLVIEVERSRGDADKPAFYRRLGAAEMWRLDISGNTREAVMLDLQAPRGPEVLEASRVLAPATPAFVLDALELAVENRLSELEAAIDARIRSAREEADRGLSL